MSDTLSLSQRITDALTGPLSSADLAALIADVSTETGNLEARRAEAERISLDPLASDEAVEAASADVVRRGLSIRRHQTAVQQLDQRMKAAAAAERQERERAFTEAAEKERDEAVAALHEQYPKLAGQIVELLRRARSAESNAQAADVRPGVEATLRPLRAGESPGYYTPFLEEVHLPNLTVRNAPLWARTIR